MRALLRASRAVLLLASGMALAASWPAGAVPAELPTAWEAPPPLRLVAPAAGAVLPAGGLTEIAWEPTADLGERVEEWEAFLSLDGGATYPVRLTPHLDARLRRATVRIPALPTADARLLLRVGDERREAALVLPQRFSIGSSTPALLAPAIARPSLAAGEPALPGEAGVVAWAEGPRGGGRTREVAATGPVGMRPVLSPTPDTPEPALDAPLPPDPAPAAAPGARAPRATSSRAYAPGRPRPRRAAGSDLLLLLRRRNE